MTPTITQEQRQAIDEHNGNPVYVVDKDREQVFVLLSSDDYQRIKPLLDPSHTDSAWSDEKNARRCKLIDKDLANAITAEERIELAVLEQQAAEHFDKIAPPPMEGADRLYQELLEKRDSRTK